MSMDNILYVAIRLIDLKMILWAILGYFALRFSFRLACIVLRDLHRFIGQKIDDAARLTGQSIQSRISPSPERIALRAAWKRQFRNTMTWSEFLKLNDKVKR